MDECAEGVPLQPPPKIGIIYNLKKGLKSDVADIEAEYDNMETILAIQSTLENGGLSTRLFEADVSLLQRLQKEPVDLAFNIAEGTSGRGREAQVPALLHMLGIPFTGSDETTLCLALDKALTKRLLSTYHIRTPRYALLNNRRSANRLSYPVLVKPNAEGSSKGISQLSVVNSHEEMAAIIERNGDVYGTMLAEEYIDGREFTVGLLGNGDSTRVFPPMEIIYSKNTQGDFRVYSYEVKRNYKEYIQYACPADISPEIQAEMVNTAKKIFNVLGCRDFARIDFRLSKEGLVYFIEINPLPGLAPGYSDYPMLAEFSGMPYDQLIMEIARAGAARCGVRL